MSTPFMARLRVGVRHGSPLVTAGVTHLLAAEDDLSVLDALDAERPDVLIADHPTAVALLSTRVSRPPPVLVLSAAPRERDVRHALELGVQGYLMLGCAPEEMLRAVRAVGRGQRWLGAEAAARMADSMARDALTQREEDVLRLLVEGCSNKVIGQRLSLALGTVKTHVKAILQKLGARSRTEAISVSVRRGLVRSGVDAPHGTAATSHAVAPPAPSAPPAQRRTP